MLAVRCRWRSVSVLCALAAGLALAPAARAQHSASVTRAELRDAGGANLYEAIARTRPGWLFLAGDTANAAATEQILVFVDGRHVGSLQALRTLDPRYVGSVNLRGAEFVRRTMPRFPRQEFQAALFVSTSAPERTGGERFSVRIHGGMQMISQARGTSDAYKDAGFDDVSVDRDQSWVDKASEMPPVMAVGVHVPLRGRYGVEAGAQRTFQGWTYGLAYPRTVFNATLSSVEGSVLATYRTSAVRLGVGPAYRRTAWTYHPRRGSGDRFTSSGLGGVASLTVMLPQEGRLFGEFTLRGAHYPSQKTPAYGEVPAVPARPTVISAGFGVGMRF